MPQFGENHPSAKLTENIVREARTRRTAGETVGALALDYGVSRHTMSFVVNRQTWKRVT